MTELKEFSELFEQDFTTDFYYRTDKYDYDKDKIDKFINTLYKQGFKAIDFYIDYSVYFIFQKDKRQIKIKAWADHGEYFVGDEVSITCEEMK